MAGFVALLITFVSTESGAQSVFESCAPDIKSFCSNVTPGNGRVFACLYAHEDKVSDACDAAIGETADIIDQVFSKIRYAMQQCRDDVTKFCSSVERGQGRVFACLNEQKTELSGACLGVIENVSLPKN